MRRYETIFIMDPDLSEEGRAPVFERLNNVIAEQNGMLVENDEWGNRKMAYEIKNKPRGYYVRMDYCGTGALVNEIERFFRIDDRVMKFLTVVLDKEADLEQIKDEMARAEAAKEQAEESRESKGEESAPEEAAETKAVAAETESTETTKEEAE